jgi:hypothetical protein
MPITRWQCPENRPLSGFATSETAKNRQFLDSSTVRRCFSTVFSTGVEILGEKPNGLVRAMGMRRAE